MSQLDGSNKQLAACGGELSNTKKTLVQIMNEKKSFEAKLNELSVKITEITNINVNLTSVKTKLEKDLSLVQHNYEDMARELKLADDRANKAANDAQHFEGLLREESVKVQKLDNVKKALETEVRNMTVRIEEIETTAISSSKRTIQKMEMRIVELEEFLSKEKAMHVETTTALHKKERSVKELLLQSEEDRKNILILQESLERLNEKIKMYKRQLEEQESISNIMRVKKFQRELESSEARAEEAESCLNAFRSQQRVFAAAAESRSREVQEVEREVVVKKNVVNVNSSSANVSRTAIQSSSSSSAEMAAQSSSSRSAAIQASSSSAMQASSSSAVQASSSAAASRSYRAGSTYSRAGSMARATSVRAGSIGRAGSMLRY